MLVGVGLLAFRETIWHWFEWSSHCGLVGIGLNRPLQWNSVFAILARSLRFAEVDMTLVLIASLIVPEWPPMMMIEVTRERNDRSVPSWRAVLVGSFGLSRSEIELAIVIREAAAR